MVDSAQTSIDPQDPIQNAMGRLGIWQIMITVALATVDLSVAWFELAIPVLAPGQNFSCVHPRPMNSSDSMMGACYVTVNQSLPDVNCQEFTYDDSDFKSTITSEWDLVCDRKVLLSLVQPLVQLGILIGNMAAGAVADKIGRKKPLIIALLIQAGAGLISAFMPTFELFLLFKFISSIATGGCMLIGPSIVIEIISVDYRSIFFVLYQIPFNLGFLMVPGFSYLTRTWNGYSIIIGALSCLLVAFCWLVPESPRWLLAVGKEEEARQVLLRAARWNKISPDTVDAAIAEHKKISEAAKSKIEGQSEKKRNDIMDMLRSKSMMLRTVIIAYNWFLDGLIFFGLEQFLGHLSRNVLTDLTISAAFQIPALVIAYFLISRVSRLKVIACSNAVAGISMLMIILFYNNATLKLILITIAMTSMSVNFPIIHLYTAELFPTVVRNLGYAVCNVSSKAGSIISPFLIDYNNELPYWVIPVVFGVTPLVGAISCYWLPETMDCKLPETIKDGKKLEKLEKNKWRDSTATQLSYIED